MNLFVQKNLSLSFLILSFCTASNIMKKSKGNNISISEESSREKFIEITLDVLKEKIALTSKRLIRSILESIYNCLSGICEEKFALFVAYSLHNTGFYTKFEKGDGTFRARGLLGLKGKDNYKIITLLSKNHMNYLKIPKLLSDVNQKVMEDTLNYFIKNELRNFNFDNVVCNINMDSQSNDDDVIIFTDIYSKLKEAYLTIKN
jgi:hypothetical protein